MQPARQLTRGRPSARVNAVKFAGLGQTMTPQAGKEACGGRKRSRGRLCGVGVMMLLTTKKIRDSRRKNEGVVTFVRSCEPCQAIVAAVNVGYRSHRLRTTVAALASTYSWAESRSCTGNEGVSCCTMYSVLSRTWHLVLPFSTTRHLSPAVFPYSPCGLEVVVVF